METSGLDNIGTGSNAKDVRHNHNCVNELLVVTAYPHGSSSARSIARIGRNAPCAIASGTLNVSCPSMFTWADSSGQTRMTSSSRTAIPVAPRWLTARSMYHVFYSTTALRSRPNALN